MISLANTTDILVATEPSWATMPGGSFTALPVLAETLIPERRILQPTHLGSGQAAADPVTTETMVVGELETMASSTLLTQFLPLALAGSIGGNAVKVAASAIDASGAIAVPDELKDKVQDGDFCWLESDDGTVKGFHEVSASAPAEAATFQITGLPLSLPPESLITLSLARLVPGEEQPSVTLARRYGEGSDWMFFDGMMIRRLVLDLAETDLPAVTASFIGRQMQVRKKAPEMVSLPTDGPLGIGAELRRFEMKGLDDAPDFTFDTGVLTRLRLIIDHAGMAPQYALGSLAPIAILPGQRHIHGMMEVLVSDATLFSALNEEKHYRLSFVLADADSGCAVVMPSVRLDGVEGAASSADGPVRVRFHFRAIPGKPSAPMIRIFFDGR